MKTLPFRADGHTYQPKQDQERLGTQYERVLALMEDGRWRTLRDISLAVSGSEASVSARLRDARKDRNGSHTVERRRVTGGLFEYRLLVRKPDTFTQLRLAIAEANADFDEMLGRRS